VRPKPLGSEPLCCCLLQIHQPLGGAQGQAADIEIQAKEILYVKARMTQFMADYCKQVRIVSAESANRDLMTHVKNNSIGFYAIWVCITSSSSSVHLFCSYCF
jgi:hypothetical protein